MFETFLKLYRTSFPIFEQRTLDQQNRAFADDRYSITLFEDQQQFVGFVAAWTFDQCVYIEHFAVSESLRGKGYGSRIMATFVEHSKKVVILEIDPIVDEKSKARLRFYEKQGFVQNDFAHYHPPYRKNFASHPLHVLSSSRKLSVTEYDAFKQALDDVVMAFEPQ